jgi:hypothetical protein
MSEFLVVTLEEFRACRKLAEKALAQVPDDRLHARLDDESNSLAVLMRHLGNNLRSRWTDFLTTDGEKPNRHRDQEFEDQAWTREQLFAQWNEGWERLLGTLESLTDDELGQTVAIRGEPHSVPRALQRSLSHTALHVGQMVMLAKHLVGPGWKTLSIARGESAAFNEKMRERFRS